MTILRSFEIDYGSHKGLTVLISDDGKELLVTQSAIERLLGWKEKQAKDKLKSAGFQSFLTGGKLEAPGKAKASGCNGLAGVTKQAKDISGRPNRHKAYPFHDFLKIVYWQLKEGNDEAAQLLIAGFADSFSSMALEQAGIQVTLEERQEVLRFYLPRYHELFDWLRDRYLTFHGERPTPEVYQRINTAIDQHLFGRSHFGGDRKKNADNGQLHEIEVFHRFAMRRVKSNPSEEPVAAILAALREY